MLGGEFGGLHYCIVINKDDKKSFGTLNVIPLTSIKENKRYYDNTVNLGDEVYNSIYNKFRLQLNYTINRLNELNNDKDNIKVDEIELLKQQLEFLKKYEKEINKMKKGSVALVNQIRTISKQRIYTPKTSKDLLSGIRVSNASLDIIDKKIVEILTK